jgi:hypothetical protein
MSTRNLFYQALTATILMALLLSQGSAATLAGPTSPRISDGGNQREAIEPSQLSGSADLLFFDDFGDGNADGWIPVSGTWSVLTGDPSIPYALLGELALPVDDLFVAGILR